MTDQVSFKTYFSLGSEEISIYVKDIISSEIIFFKKRKLEKGKEDPFENEIQSFFLEKISEIEKQIKLFVNNIILIIEDESIFFIKFSIKQKIENRKISEEEFKNLLSNGLQEIYKYNHDNMVIHYIIDKIYIDDQIVEKTKGIDKVINNNLSLNLRFICIEKQIVSKFKDLFKKKQISLEKIFSTSYLNEFKNLNKNGLMEIVTNIEKGYNEFEVELVPKKPKKKGFFENFFLSFQ